jgi:hypothetical protein
VVTLRRRLFAAPSFNCIFSNRAAFVTLRHREDRKREALYLSWTPIDSTGKRSPPVPTCVYVLFLPSFHHAIDQLGNVRISVSSEPIPGGHESFQIWRRFLNPVSTIQISSSAFTTSMIAFTNRFVKKNST